MNKLEKYRKEQKLSYVELGKKLGVSQPTAWRLCNCIKNNLNFNMLKKISRLTGIEIVELISGYTEKD